MNTDLIEVVSSIANPEDVTGTVWLRIISENQGLFKWYFQLYFCSFENSPSVSAENEKLKSASKIVFL